MAFTKAPVNDTHNVIRITPEGNPFVVAEAGVAPVGVPGSEGVYAPTLSCIDCFQLTEKMWNGESRTTIQKRAGFTYSICSGTVITSGACGKAIVCAEEGGYAGASSIYPYVFFSKDKNYYKFNISTKVISHVITGSTTYLANFSSGTLAIDNTNTRKVCFLAGPILMTCNQDGSSASTTDLWNGGTGVLVDGERGLVFINGYLYAVNYDGNKIYNSKVGGLLTTWQTTDFIDAEQYPDEVVFIDKHKNFLVAFGTKSIEFFYDAGIEIGSPLARQENYSRQIGMYVRGDASGGKKTAKIDDDIYFLGVKENQGVGLYRIRNFQIEEIDNQYASHILNYTSVDPKVNLTGGLETIWINQNPMIVINNKNQYQQLVYFPQEDSWWILTANPFFTGDFPTYNLRAGTQFFAPDQGIQYFLAQDNTTSSSMYYYMQDMTNNVSVTSTIYTPIIDLGINYWKHIARVDALGDFGNTGNNIVTLSYNPTPVYSNTYVTCSSKTVGVSGSLGNNTSWYNIGPWRRGSFKITIAGKDPASYEGLDIEYNVGAA